MGNTKNGRLPRVFDVYDNLNNNQYGLVFAAYIQSEGAN